jgi:hypothetical protein
MRGETIVLVWDRPAETGGRTRKHKTTTISPFQCFAKLFDEKEQLL